MLPPRRARFVLALCSTAALTTMACTPGAALDDTAPPSDTEGPGSDAPEEQLVDAAHADDLFGLHGVEPRRLPPVPIQADLDPGAGLMKVFHDDQWVALVLQETAYDTHVVGTIAETTVTQMFVNPFDTPIEAVYQFPLPEDGAVDDYWFHLGEHHVQGVMKRREEARQDYERAKREGKSAALLDQERPNIFTQSVANIPAGETIVVEMHLVQPLHQKDGVYSLALPTTIGPRFIPGAPTDAAGNTDAVPDAERITPPTLPPGMRNGSDLDISIHVDTPLAVAELHSPTHGVTTHALRHGASMELRRGDAIPNKDFVAQWSLAGDAPRVSLQTQEVDGKHYFALTLQPPAKVSRDQARARELIFVVDNSCSMSGVPLDTAKRAMHRALDDVGTHDRFQVLRFSESASGLSKGPLPATDANLERGHDYVTDMYGMGGTHMLSGITAALNQPHDPSAIQMVLFMTDGYIGNETQIFEAIDAGLDDARLFSMGIGSSVNRFLLDGMADMGRGTVTYVGAETSPDQAVAAFYETIGYPVLTDVDIDWRGLPVDEVVPGRIPDLFSGQPVVVYGKFEDGFDPARAAKTTVTLEGRLGDEKVRYEVPIDVTQANARSTGVAALWARERVSDLTREHWLAPDEQRRDALEEEITQLALSRAIMTEYTSFVAVLHERTVDEAGATVYVPNEMPEGVTFESKRRGTAPPAGGVTGGTVHGVGGLGLVGSGGGGGTGSGYGRGTGAGFGGKGKRVPQVRQAKAVVTGSLDRDVIRRIVRGHINEVRGCYNDGLSRDPSVAGRVTIQFEIGPDGKVIAATVKQNDTGDDDLAKCIAQRARRWKFPKPPGAGRIVVSYPFALSPG